MTQDQALILAFRVTEAAAVVTIVTFVACYTRWAPWHRDPIGRTIVLKDLALMLALVPSLLSVFFRFGHMAARVATWFDLAAFALVPVIMTWRIYVFRRIHREGLLRLRHGGREAVPDEPA